MNRITFITKLVTQRGTYAILFSIMDKPETPPVTRLTGAYIFFIANAIINAPIVIKI